MTETINTMSDALKVGAQTTVIGLVIVFAVLIILMLVLMAMKAIFYKEPEVKAQPAPMPVPQAVSAAEEAAEDEEALIAVLTAAVAASLNTSTYNLQIKSYRRIDQRTSAWNKAGVRETINSRF